MRRACLLLLTALALVSCRAADDGRIAVLVTAADEALVKEGVAFVGDARLVVQVVADPKAALAQRGGAGVALVTRDDCAECYRLEGSGRQVQVHGGTPLGKQYGLWHALEAMGYRFVHPWHTKVPEALLPVAAGVFGVEHSPVMKKRRGLHLHTLHPIEGLYDTWLPGAENLEGGQRTIDFVIKNRGNYVQWCALDDIVKDPSRVPAWRAHTKALTDFAHARGVRVGAALQLFGESNLQNAFDLIDDPTGDPAPELERRLHVLLDGTGFDALNLSFGEFFGAEPARFVAQVDAAYAAMQRVQPGVEVMATIHVGNYENLRVDYQGERQLYYFLVRYANPAIVPWVHTTMFYNLYDDAGLAYLHEQFDEHRAYLEGRLRADAPVGYFPESAYWIAFDINIPVFLPVYVRSRHTDLARLAEAGPLEDHVLFSSGWEWGYWLTDATTLRMNYERPAAWGDAVREVYAAWGADGVRAGDLVVRLGEAQHRALIGERLAAYVASRDQIIDTGDRLGIFSQPDRPEFAEVAALSSTGRDAFRARVVTKLQAHAEELTALEAEVAQLPDADPVLAELRDGVQVTAARVRFIHALYAATLEYAASGGDGGFLAKAEAELTAAKAIVARRRRALWDPDPRTLISNGANPTFYQYGYLREGDTLCFWGRERAQARQLILQTGDTIPGCVL